MRQLDYQNQIQSTFSTAPATLPSLGILTQVDELSRYDLIYLYHKLKAGSELEIEQDKTRSWDDNALSVSFNGRKIGYVSQKTSAIVRKKIAQGFAVSAKVKSVLSDKFMPLKSLDIQIFVL
jgi:hypothetical protein